MAKSANAGQGQPKLTPQQLNQMQRQAVLGSAVEMKQQIFSQAIDPTAQLGPLTINPRNVGLIKYFRIIVEGAVINTHGSQDATVSPFGFLNTLSNVQFTDLNNNLRVNTAGWHLGNLGSAKKRWPMAAALVQSAFGSGPLSEPAQYGNNFPVVVAPKTITHGAGATPFRIVYDLPLAYSDDDLRGAVFANVVNATMQIGLTVNPNAFVANSGADWTFAIARGGTVAFSGNIQVTVYQYYLDQLPVGKSGVVLPILDLSTVYELKNTVFTGMTPGQDYPVPYTNFRDFLSTFAVYNSTGDETGLGNGADINTWALQSANFTNLWKLDPLTAAQEARDIIGTDFPLGTYYFSSRRKPISTNQYGNMELVLNPIDAESEAYLSIGWEDFALVNTLTQAGSLAA